MSEAARDQGWLSPDELEHIRAELASDEPPVSDVTGIEWVAATRRMLEEKRRQQREEGDDG